MGEVTSKENVMGKGGSDNSGGDATNDRLL